MARQRGGGGGVALGCRVVSLDCSEASQVASRVHEGGPVAGGPGSPHPRVGFPLSEQAGDHLQTFVCKEILADRFPRVAYGCE